MKGSEKFRVAKKLTCNQAKRKIKRIQIHNGLLLKVSLIVIHFVVLS